MCEAPDSSRTAYHLRNRAPCSGRDPWKRQATRPEVVIVEFVLLLLLVVVGFVVVGVVMDIVAVVTGVVVVSVDMRLLKLWLG